MHDIYAFPLSKKDYFVAETTDEKIDRMCREALQEIADMSKDAIARFYPQETIAEFGNRNRIIDCFAYDQVAAMNRRSAMAYAMMDSSYQGALSQFGLAQIQSTFDLLASLKRFY
jgi:hypothetical protein